jgi:Pyruvate/2-oxoacid:ferredoxin oxidoreductase delta subunit
LKRSIIKIDEDLCNGCGNCIPNCPEGAIQIIDEKARLISDLFCDGLGACLGHCPQGAISTEVREAEPYNERKVMENIVKAGSNTIIAHLEHLQHHGECNLYNQAVSYLKEKDITLPGKEYAPCNCKQHAPAQKYAPVQIKVQQTQHLQKIKPSVSLKSEETLACGCSGSLARMLEPESDLKQHAEHEDEHASIKSTRPSELRNWPIQLKLLPTQGKFYQNADLLISADCVGSSYPEFHRDFVKGRTLIIGCPKLDDAQYYIEKLTEIFKLNSVKSIRIVMMDVPCCSGLNTIIKQALKASGKQILIESVIVTAEGHIKS